MGSKGPVLVAATWLALGASAGATEGYQAGEAGRLVQVSLELEGRRSPLYPAPDGSGRFYVEALAGRSYALVLENRTGERLGAAVAVDGLNVVSGEPEQGRGRMYVLDPWETTTIRGWRSSLSDVQKFVFVDERASYAARSGKPTRRLGWIEVKVFRERQRWHAPPACCDTEPRPYPVPMEDRFQGERERDRKADGGAAAAATPAPSASAPRAAQPRDEARTESQESADVATSDRGLAKPGVSSRADRFPGTGWGPRASDPVTVVSFDPEPAAAEQITLRYEYAPALRALGIKPWPELGRDRLRERERGDWGFARPPTR